MSKQYDSFPYNENQRQLHFTEDRYIENIDSSVKYFAKTKKEKDALRKKLLDRMEETKAQDPHPAEILADFPCCFWDTDLYWIHWDRNKNFIIPRMLEGIIEQSIVVLEKFYTKEEILNALTKTRENMSDETFEFIANRYNMTFVPNIRTSPYDPQGIFCG